MVTICTEHDRSRNMEDTFRGNHKTLVYPTIKMVITCTEHTRSTNTFLLYIVWVSTYLDLGAKICQCSGHNTMPIS